MRITSLIAVVFWKEWMELSRAKVLNRFFLFFPLILVIQTTVFILPAASVRLPEKVRADIIHDDSRLETFADPEIIQIVYARRIALFILVVPMTIGIQIGAFAFSGEKAARTLEPLLATPISTERLLLAKVLSGLIPALGLGYLMELIFIVLLRCLTGSWALVGASLTGPFHLLSLVGSPLLTLLGISAAVISSARTDDPRVAVQLANLVVLPVLALCVAFIYLKGVGLDFSVVYFFLAGALMVCLAVWRLALRFFQRESILSRINA